MNWAEIRHFSKDEWRYDWRRVDPALIKAMDYLRELADCPIHIHEAWADRKGQHGKGEAVDFHFAENRFTVSEQLLFIRQVPAFKRIGFYPEWFPVPGWHIDLKDENLVWVKRDNKYIYGDDNFLCEFIYTKFWRAKCIR